MEKIFLLILASALGSVFCSLGGSCGYNPVKLYDGLVIEKREPLQPKSLSLPIKKVERESPYIPSEAVIRLSKALGINEEENLGHNGLDDLLFCHQLRSTYGDLSGGGSYDVFSER
jgi:hypothetical protein